MASYCLTPEPFVRTSCILSHYNYGEYVEEACESALRQGRPLDEILLVDDGSTDGSLERLRSRYGGGGPVRLLEKAHGGQLSCFNAGFRASTGDIVFFLDADDAYEPGYVEAVVEIYERRSDVDFVFVAHRTFGTLERVRSEGTGDRDLGYSVVRTLARRRWIGAPTSCLSMRRHVLEKILPLPFEEDWTVRADDCLVFGASIVGARKYYVDRPLVRYRLHHRNAHAGRPYDAAADYRRKLALARLLAHLEERTGYHGRRLSEFAHREFRTIERPRLVELRDYVRIALRAEASWGRRLGILGSILGHYALAGRDLRIRRRLVSEPTSR